MQEKELSRRMALKCLTVVPTAAVVLSACGKKTEPDSCQDVSALSDAEKSARSALQYTDRSPNADKYCSICTFWRPASDPAQCGSCQLVKGPIHPKGYCTGFAAKTPA